MLQLLRVWIVALLEERVRVPIRIGVHEDRTRRQTVASRSTDFLVVTLHARRQREVNDRPDVCLIDAHPERDGGDHNVQPAGKESVLSAFAFLRRQTRTAMGGGGKGMRLVTHPDEFTSSLARARGEALSSFGDDSVYVEKAIVRPRHIEIQVFSDTHGNHVYMHERECSVQRRHQKVIEEAPSPHVTPENAQGHG